MPCPIELYRTSQQTGIPTPLGGGPAGLYTAVMSCPPRSLRETHTLAAPHFRSVWEELGRHDYVAAPRGASVGPAVSRSRPGSKHFTFPGGRSGGDANSPPGLPYQSLYPANSAPSLVRRINNALRRADQIQWSEGVGDVDWFVPIVADGEAGFGGALSVFELTKSFIEAGAAGAHFEDQLAAEKKCAIWVARCWCRRANTSGPCSRPARLGGLEVHLLVVREPTQRRQPFDSDSIPGPRILHRRAGPRGILPGSGRALTRQSPGQLLTPPTQICSVAKTAARPARAARFASAI